MSDGYTLDHILEECMADKSGFRASSGPNFYEETWYAVNAWIESRLAKRKGATLGMLGTFTWETRVEDGETLSRPIFLLSDSFVKNYHVKRQRIHSVISTAPSEDINYSKIAIKFSKSLTKDMVFSGLRDIVKKIGEYIQRSYKFSVGFNFGALRSSEKKVKFDFNYARFAEILPENLQPGYTARLTRNAEDMNGSEYGSTHSSDMAGTGGASRKQLSARSSSSSSSSAIMKPPIPPSRQQLSPIKSKTTMNMAEVPELNFSKDNNLSGREYFNRNLQSQQQQRDTLINVDTNDHRYAANEESEDQSPWEENPFTSQLSPDSQRVVQAMQEKDMKEVLPPSRDTINQRRVMSSETVQEQAYLRCLNALESQAFKEDVINTSSQETHDDWVNHQKKRKEDSKNKVKDLEKFLQTQIKEFHDRKVKEKSDRRDACINHELPGYIAPKIDGVVTNRTSPADGPLRIVTNSELVSSLDQQLKYNKERKLISKQQRLQEERGYLDHVAMEMELQSAAEKAAHLEKQKTLLEAWEREAHIRNLKKLQKKGMEAVSTYMNSNLPTHRSEGLYSNNKSRSMGNMGIGFDVRKVS
mmetsp:Transcript_13689/g.13753  ORF Transcript_13689/g.13753 Transcript_13689/m.13753 type:complete len:586 (-) Transcript_13689:190-1947(-)